MADIVDIKKMDVGFKMALRAYEESCDKSGAEGISVLLRFEGDLAPIEVLGFETHSVSGGEAVGVVRFKDIEALVAHPGVIRITAGKPRKTYLDTAVADIRARASAPISGAAVDGLWHAFNENGAFTNVPNATGKDVIIAIIDTGIDYKHPMFMSQLTPTKKTRILRIWDQGLVPTSLAECPPVERLKSTKTSTKTYGVEYDSNEIETDLNGGAAILHKDCDGHGTHVGGIAAGGRLFPIHGNASKVGVAPEADLIVVKYLDTPEKIFYPLATGVVGPEEVSWSLRLRDAVFYCLRTARDLGKSIVINMSFGDSAMPGDGLDDDARWIDDLMDPTKTPGSENFPTGAIIVKAAGNDGDDSSRQVARIEVPSSGEIIVPFKLVDDTDKHETWKQCSKQPHKPEVGVHFWYRRTSAPLAVQFAMRLPHGSAFGSDVAVDSVEFEIGFRALVGPPPNDIAVQASSSVHRAGIYHEDSGSVPHPAGGSVHRHYAYFFVKPKESGGTISYHQGIYLIRIKAPATTVVYAMCDWEDFSAGNAVFFCVPTRSEYRDLDETHIHVTSESSAIDTLGQHVITVSAYDDKNGIADPMKGEIALFSSRGPLRDFSNPDSQLPLIADKPDIAAPGVDIVSAEGLDTEPPLVKRLLPDWHHGVRFASMDGTSMATPMIAGVIALMLDKKNDLNTTEVRTILSRAPRAAVKPSTVPESTHAYGHGMVDALSSHKNTP